MLDRVSSENVPALSLGDVISPSRSRVPLRFENALSFAQTIHPEYRPSGDGRYPILRTLKKLRKIEDTSAHPEERAFVRSTFLNLRDILINDLNDDTSPDSDVDERFERALLALAQNPAPRDIPYVIGALLTIENNDPQFARAVFERFSPIIREHWGVCPSLSNCIDKVLPIVGEEILSTPYREVLEFSILQLSHPDRSERLTGWTATVPGIERVAEGLFAQDLSRSFIELLDMSADDELEIVSLLRSVGALLQASEDLRASITVAEFSQLFERAMRKAPIGAGKFYNSLYAIDPDCFDRAHQAVRKILCDIPWGLSDEETANRGSMQNFLETIGITFGSKFLDESTYAHRRILVDELRHVASRPERLVAEFGDAYEVVFNPRCFDGWGSETNALYRHVTGASATQLYYSLKALSARTSVHKIRDTFANRWNMEREIPVCADLIEQSRLVHCCRLLNLDSPIILREGKRQVLSAIGEKLLTLTPTQHVAADLILEDLANFEYVGARDVQKLKPYLVHRMRSDADLNMCSLLKIVAMTFDAADVTDIWPVISERVGDLPMTTGQLYPLYMLGAVYRIPLPNFLPEFAPPIRKDGKSPSISLFEAEVYAALETIPNLKFEHNPAIGKAGITPDFVCQYRGQIFAIEAYGHFFHYIDSNVKRGLFVWDRFRESYLRAIYTPVLSVQTIEWYNTSFEERPRLLLDKIESLTSATERPS